MYLELQNLTVRYGKLFALDNLSLRIEKGEIFGFIGPNGSGKTTCLKAIIGLLRLTSGRIVLDGEVVEPGSMGLKKMTGYCPQENSIFNRLTVKENIRYFSYLYDIPGKSKIPDRVSRYVNLADKAEELAENLSGGMKRRLNIACSIVHSPEILLLDEPTVELDPFSKKVVWELVGWINKQGTTVLIATNSMEEIEYLCSRVAFLDKGSVHSVGPPGTVIRDVQRRTWWSV